jgi:hypothetical protein
LHDSQLKEQCIKAGSEQPLLQRLSRVKPAPVLKSNKIRSLLSESRDKKTKTGGGKDRKLIQKDGAARIQAWQNQQLPPNNVFLNGRTGFGDRG